MEQNAVFRSQFQGITYACAFGRGNRLRVEIYFAGSQDYNEKLFDALNKDRAEIEAAIGSTLDWQRKTGQTQCRIATYWPDRVEDAEPSFGRAARWAGEQLIKFNRVFGARIGQMGM